MTTTASEAADRPGLREWLTLVLLPFGGLFTFGLGWLAGVLLLWTSHVWTVRDKWIGTLVVPGGCFSALLVAGATAGHQQCSQAVGGRSMVCVGGQTTLEQVVPGFLAGSLALAAVASAFYLLRQSRRNATGTVRAA